MDREVSETQARLMGAAMIAVGLILVWGFLIEPLMTGHNDPALAKRALVAVVVMPAALIYGALLLRGGSRAYYKYMDPESLRVDSRGWVVAPIALAIGGLLYWWFSAQMHATTFNRLIPPHERQIELD